MPTNKSVGYSFVTNPEDDEISDLTYSFKTEIINSEDGTSKAIITINTNRPSKGSISWGQTKLNNKVNFGTPRSTNNVITLTNLKPETTYLYQASIEDVFKQKKLSYKFELITPPTELNIATSFISDNQYNKYDDLQDFDKDCLTNGQEKIYGTSPIKSDSDGYVDGIEVIHGYDPMGLDRLIKARTVSTPEDIYAYNKSRMDKTEEQNNAIILKTELEKKFNGPIPLDKQYWPIYVNAYTYGDYPVEAIYKSIKLSGKTVHREISWTSWKNSDIYKSNITR